MCSTNIRHLGNGSTSPRSLAKLKALTRRLVQRIFPVVALQSSPNKMSCCKEQNNNNNMIDNNYNNNCIDNNAPQAREIAENEANERLLQEASINEWMPRVQWLQTHSGCFYWDAEVQKSRPADLDLRPATCSQFLDLTASPQHR